MIMQKSNRKLLKIFFFIVFPIFIFIISFMIGKYPISPSQLVQVVFSKINEAIIGNNPIATWEKSVETVIFKIRLPRIIAAMMVGSALSVAGVSYQGMFKNPLVSPDILGASAGAGFGASLAITLSFSLTGIQISAFLFSIIAVILVYFASKIMKNNQILGLVLAGMLIGSLFSSFTSFLKFIADPNDKLPSIIFWLMGGLSSIQYKDLIYAGIPILIGILPLFFLRWRINLLTFGDEEARAMGINTKRLRFVVIICATLITAASVSISGMIGWVGLVVPHFSRMLVGPNYKVLIPTTIVIGSSYLLTVDNFARMLATVEIPLGILTSIIGAPFFLFLILYKRREH